jgi:hypothetical protein
MLPLVQFEGHTILSGGAARTVPHPAQAEKRVGETADAEKARRVDTDAEMMSVGDFNLSHAFTSVRYLTDRRTGFQ